MSILTPTDGELFRLTSVKSWTSGSPIEFRNSYVVQTGASTTSDELSTIAQGISYFERLLLSSKVFFKEVLISTYLPDSNPYDGTEFKTHPINAYGERATDKIPLALEQVLVLTRNVATGKSGKLPIRGVLTDDSIVYDNGNMVLVSLTYWQTLISTSLEATNLSDYMESGSSDVRFVIVSKTGAKRQISTFSIDGPAFMQVNRRRTKRTSFTP
jgi:hypothetical protein